MSVKDTARAALKGLIEAEAALWAEVERTGKAMCTAGHGSVSDYDKAKELYDACFAAWELVITAKNSAHRTIKGDLMGEGGDEK